jgi:hypothetical protein
MKDCIKKHRHQTVMAHTLIELVSIPTPSISRHTLTIWCARQHSEPNAELDRVVVQLDCKRCKTHLHIQGTTQFQRLISMWASKVTYEYRKTEIKILFSRILLRSNYLRCMWICLRGSAGIRRIIITGWEADPNYWGSCGEAASLIFIFKPTVGKFT